MMPSASEYVGTSMWLPADRYGPEHYPVGRVACARRDCSGCCYCRNRPPPPVFLDVVEYRCLSGSLGDCRPYRRRITVDALRLFVYSQFGDDCRELLSDPVPAYLIDRQPQWSSSGRVIHVSGSIRDLVSARQLACMSDDLQGSTEACQ